MDVIKCNHPVDQKCLDLEVSAALEAGAKCLYQSSINAVYSDSWKWLTPHIRNRWRWRFQISLNAYEREMQ